MTPSPAREARDDQTPPLVAHAFQREVRVTLIDIGAADRMLKLERAEGGGEWSGSVEIDMGNIRRYKPIASGDWSSLFGPPQLLEGEDAAAYDALLAQVRAAVKPLDAIEEIFVADVVFSVWEFLRWRRLKFTLMRACGSAVLETFLEEKLDYDQYAEEFGQSLVDPLEQHLAAAEAEKLAQQCAQWEQNAVDKVRKLLANERPDMDQILNNARAQSAKHLAQEYARHERNAVKLVNELLASSGLTLDNLLVDGLFADDQEYLTMVERFDRLITTAEARRNNSLHEIDWHRATLGKAVRRTIENIEESELRVIEAVPAKGKAAR